ncbi:hypothetical protein CFHF_17925 [Caulobacter flavus]|uniref:Peptidase S9 prolyl oligopeptidase catalytic domain-containing protein n=1 Tax=Caulobacter flavus TaxID=1679497 RepID=A0A2N5CQ86_9CAUL|nr:prolyl oligopeptidase family serine peptidase [Caulobacter flavus]AYV46247.1 hypothetical protein C1707_08260 [Caulobacter flavus]PLR09967.1 hypothetical protein CFHF_17925 [Caulobacter flavus]
MIFRSSWLGRLLAAWLALVASAAGAKPLTLDRLLSLEELGQSALSPGGRWVVIETQRPYDQAPSFDFETAAASLGRLMVAELAGDGAAKPLFEAEANAGYLAGPFSPDGRRMVVFRWRDHCWDAGVVELGGGSVRWLGLPIEQALYGRSLQWVSNEVFVAIALPAGEAPLHLKLGWQNQARTRELWSRQAAGAAPSVIVTSAGPSRGADRRSDRRLVRFDLSTGQITTLAEGGFFDIELSPSRRYLAALGEAEPMGLQADQPVRMGAPTRRRAVSIVDLQTGAVREPCSNCTALIQPMAWSPTGDRLLVYQHQVGAPEADGGLVVIEAADGRRSPLAQAPRPEIGYGGEGFATVQADWLGAAPIVLARREGAVRSDWYALGAAGAINLTAALPGPPGAVAIGQDQRLLVLVEGRVWRVGMGGKAVPTGVAGATWFRPSAFGAGARPSSAPPKGERLLLRSQTGLADLSGNRWEPPAGAVVLDRTGAGLLVEERKVEGERRVMVARGGAPVRELVRLNQDVARLDRGQIRAIETMTPSGIHQKSWLYLPPGWREGDRPPLIVVPYPGSAPQKIPSRFRVSAQNLTPSAPYLAAQGYAVLAPALPRDPTLGEPASGLADQILAVVDEVVARGLVDPDRLALWGHSFGGYAGLAVATQSDRFKAVIAQAGPGNYLSRWGAVQPYFVTAPEDGAPNPLYMGYGETGQGALLGPPWRQAERYVRNSPLLQADKINTPLLLIYGDQDQVPLAEGQAMLNALYRQDKDATLLTLMGEGHVPTSPANIRAIYALVLPWLAARLSRPAEAAASEPSLPSQ